MSLPSKVRPRRTGRYAPRITNDQDRSWSKEHATMIKLVTVFAFVAATLITGCKRKERTEHDQPGTAPKTTEPAQPSEKTPETVALPVECTEYKATIEKIRTCEALPQVTRDALVQAFNQASSGWATATAEARASLASSCRSANDAIQQSAAACE